MKYKLAYPLVIALFTGVCGYVFFISIKFRNNESNVAQATALKPVSSKPSNIKTENPSVETISYLENKNTSLSNLSTLKGESLVEKSLLFDDSVIQIQESLPGSSNSKLIESDDVIYISTSKNSKSDILVSGTSSNNTAATNFTSKSGTANSSNPTHSSSTVSNTVSGNPASSANSSDVSTASYGETNTANSTNNSSGQQTNPGILTTSYGSHKLQRLFTDLPKINSAYSPLDEKNKTLLFTRFTSAFDLYYETYYNDSRNFAADMRFYYLRQELQALIDMHRATCDSQYLEQARHIVQKAISDATTNSRTLLFHNQNRGTWPCFLLKSTIPETGGHSQLNDFQGATGFMMVASTLKEANMDGWQDIADFVETNIIEKWLYQNPARTIQNFTGDLSCKYLLGILNQSRDKRVHFSSICLDLDHLGYTKYPYQLWGELLIKIHLTERTSLTQPYPESEYRRSVPTDWGLYRQYNNTLIWYWGTNNFSVLDTSHANRTVWCACQAFKKGLITENILNGIIATFKTNIWDTSKGPFYFKNYIDGTDGSVQSCGPGQKGNLWFGWHRLAAYDSELKDLFVSLGYDLTIGGFHIDSQNKGMQNAPLCLIAWASRLISEDGSLYTVP